MTDFLPIHTRSSFPPSTPPLLMLPGTSPPLLLFRRAFLFAFCLFFHQLKLLLFPPLPVPWKAITIVELFISFKKQYEFLASLPP